MIIGTFTYDSHSDSFEGDIMTLHFQFCSIDVKPTAKKGDTEPDYRITADRRA